MAVLPVVQVGHPVLHRPTETCGGPIPQLAQDLIDTMKVSPGCIGLAANQIGINKRAFVVDVSQHFKAKKANHGLIVLFDPELIDADGDKIEREGCMSVPDFTANVKRWRRIVVRGIDPQGEEVLIRAKGFESRALQHELDHLNGKIILDRVASLRSDIFHRVTYL